MNLFEKSLDVYTDGGSRGNPGHAATGVVIKDTDGNVIREHKRYIGIATNNTAEYNALLDSVKLLEELRNEGVSFDTVNFHLDSELVVKQINGIYRIKHPDMQDLHGKFYEAIRNLGIKKTVKHVLRSENKHADKLVNFALDEQRKGIRN